MSSPARRRRAPGLCRIRLQDRGRQPVGVHEHRIVGVLFRYPQRHAVLRSAVVAGAQGRADRHRHSLRRHPELAGAGAELHLRRGLAALPAGRRAVGAPDAVSGKLRRISATRSWRPNGRRSAMSAASSPAHWKSSALPSGSARRWRPRRWSTSSRQRHFRHAVRRRSGRGLHHLERDGDQCRRAGRGVPAERGTWRRRGGRAGGRHQMRPLVEDPPHASAKTPTTPTFRRAMPRRCANGRRLEPAV